MAQVRIGCENSAIHLGLIKIGLQKSVSPLEAVARVSKIIQNIKIMILELATIDIKQGTNAEFERHLEQAQYVLSQAEGYIEHEFQKCIENENRYILLIKWASLEAHIGDAANGGTEGFRGSELFKEWRGLIGQFFEKPPHVEHFELKFNK